MAALIAVIGFGAIGVALRFGIDSWLTQENQTFPWAIFAINVVGCLIAGALSELPALKNAECSFLRTALLVGFCGGFTTFSTYSVQALQLLERQSWLAFAGYTLGSPLAGLLAASIGITLAKHL